MPITIPISDNTLKVIRNHAKFIQTAKEADLAAKTANEKAKAAKTAKDKHYEKIRALIVKEVPEIEESLIISIIHTIASSDRLKKTN